MIQQEGVVKFKLEFSAGPALPYIALRELNAWRKILYMTNLIGEDPTRYGGYGYGNVSIRLEPLAGTQQPCFAISGTQTGSLPDLTEQHYSIVTECWPDENRVVAHGPIKPSSESMTHSMLYRLDDSYRFVYHVHSPVIWRCGPTLGIPCTSDKVPYGTPEMAQEVRRLFDESTVRQQMIFAMGGHEHGIVTFGDTVNEAGGVIIDYLSRALSLV